MSCEEQVKHVKQSGMLSGGTGVITVKPMLDIPDLDKHLALKMHSGGEKGEWNFSESEYVLYKMFTEKKSILYSIEHYKKEIEKLSSRASKKKETYLHRIKTLEKWLEPFDDQRPEVMAEKIKEYQEMYVDVLKRAISKGKSVNGQAVDENEALQKARAARERYEKGWNTSFANQSEAVNDSMQSERGYKVKRQDGKEMPQSQIEEIDESISEIESVVGDLSDVFRAMDITISHTNGKHPFLSKNAGQYNPKERTVSAGWRSKVDKSSVKQMAHEIAHSLDDYAGEISGARTAMRKDRNISYTYSLMASESKDWNSDSGKLLNQAKALMNDRYGFEIKALQKMKATDATTDINTRKSSERSKLMLGSYWSRPQEVFARLFEQYISTNLQKDNSLSVYRDYTSTPGYWSEREWMELEPLIKNEIERRLQIIRGKE